MREIADMGVEVLFALDVEASDSVTGDSLLPASNTSTKPVCIRLWDFFFPDGLLQSVTAYTVTLIANNWGALQQRNTDLQYFS